MNRLLQGNYKIFPEICEKVSKIDVFSQKRRSYSKQITKLFILWMYQLIGCRIITHSQLNRLLQGNYKIFPEICEKVSKIDVFSQKRRSSSEQITKLLICLDASPNVMSNHNSFKVESCDTRKIWNVSRNLWKNVKNWCFLPKNRQLYSANVKIIFLYECSCFICT